MTSHFEVPALPTQLQQASPTEAVALVAHTAVESAKTPGSSASLGNAVSQMTFGASRRSGSN
jgi:hypothetical protein